MLLAMGFGPPMNENERRFLQWRRSRQTRVPGGRGLDKAYPLAVFGAEHLNSCLAASCWSPPAHTRSGGRSRAGEREARTVLYCLFVPANRRDWTELSQLSGYPNSLMVRTDFEHETEWQAVLGSIDNPGSEVGTDYRAALEVIQDPRLGNFEAGQLIAALPYWYRHSFFFVVDQKTLEDIEHPILIVDLLHDKGRTFRLVPAQIHSIEANLSLSNMDFLEFADSADADGVFRGFRKA
jgi:hypothetical protein